MMLSEEEAQKREKEGETGERERGDREVEMCGGSEQLSEFL